MKVFGIGLQRTGLTSLTQALNVIGIPTRQFPWPLYDDLAHPLLDEYAGFTDFPIPLLYQRLDVAFPGSKFIHTVRDEAAWLDSVAWLFTTGTKKFAEAWTIAPRFHRAFYGTTAFDGPRFLARYRRYNQAVTEYFAARPGDYLRLNLIADPGYAPLCRFLQRPRPGTPFPHRNKQQNRLQVWLWRWRRRLTRSFPFLT